MEIFAILDKETISFRTEVYLGGWLKVSFTDEHHFTPYGFLVPNSSIDSVLAVIEGDNDPYDTVTYRALVIDHNGNILDFKSTDNPLRSIIVRGGHYTKIKGLTTYAPSAEGEGCEMLDLLSQMPDILPKAGIVSPETAIDFFRRNYPFNGYYQTLRLEDIVKRLNEEFPEPKKLTVGTRLVLNKD